MTRTEERFKIANEEHIEEFGEPLDYDEWFENDQLELEAELASQHGRALWF